MTNEPSTLDGIRVVEFSHMVMGPTCGLILADLGANDEVVQMMDGLAYMTGPEERPLRAGATVEVTLSNGVRTQVPTLPFEYGGTRPGLYRDLPQIGEHNEAVARELGYSDEALERLRSSLGSAAIASE